MTEEDVFIRHYFCLMLLSGSINSFQNIEKKSTFC